VSTESLIERLAAAAGVAQGELEMALLIAEVIDPDTDPVPIRSGVHQLLAGLAESEPMTAAGLLDALVAAGFGGSAGQSTITAWHSHLGWVLEHRKGIPISLAALIIAVARDAGMDAVGVNYPGHFLVRMQGAFVDPLRLTIIDESGLTPATGELAVADARATGLRMLNNLKALAVSERDWPRVLQLIDYQMAVAGDSSAHTAHLLFERAEYWRQLGAFAAAREAYLRCADLSVDGDLKAKARQHAKNLDGRNETLH
jgi:regulator of sirC expression with transglutaminase-like and TPR domain